MWVGGWRLGGGGGGGRHNGGKEEAGEGVDMRAIYNMRIHVLRTINYNVCYFY